MRLVSCLKNKTWCSCSSFQEPSFRPLLSQLPRSRAQWAIPTQRILFARSTLKESWTLVSFVYLSPKQTFQWNRYFYRSSVYLSFSPSPRRWIEDAMWWNTRQIGVECLKPKLPVSRTHLWCHFAQVTIDKARASVTTWPVLFNLYKEGSHFSFNENFVRTTMRVFKYNLEIGPDSENHCRHFETTITNNYSKMISTKIFKEHRRLFIESIQ